MNSIIKQKINQIESNYKIELIWSNTILIIGLHLGAIYGIVLIITECKFETLIFSIILALLSGIGVQVRSY